MEKQRVKSQRYEDSGSCNNSVRERESDGQHFDDDDDVKGSTIGMKFIYSAIAAYRNYSTKSTRKSTTWDQNSFKNRNPSAKTKWIDQQAQILDAISKGKSVFITGSAGTGKTVLLKRIIKIA
ncbi:hypothetical protein L1049_025031 [Liquidambar formosana]|uniref:NACHT domain-containing protein n=1 Tax=Liquidambar formosana TaxID=63359 RepID=A0AAP0S2W9_LIQFO